MLPLQLKQLKIQIMEELEKKNAAKELEKKMLLMLQLQLKQLKIQIMEELELLVMLLIL